jgi:hypothetical protein
MLLVKLEPEMRKRNANEIFQDDSSGNDKSFW